MRDGRQQENWLNTWCFHKSAAFLGTLIGGIAVAIKFPNTLSLIRLAFFLALIRLRFEAFDFLELARGFLLSSQLLVATRQQITSLGVVRLIARGLLQRAHGFCRPPLFEE